MKKKIEEQQLKHIKNFLLSNKYRKMTALLKGFRVLLLLGLVMMVMYFIIIGKDKIILRESGYSKKDERIKGDFNKGETLHAEDSVDRNVYLLKKDRVEVLKKNIGVWKTYSIPFEGKYITVVKDKVAVLSKNGELYVYDKDFKNFKIIYDNTKSNKIKNINEIELIYPIGDKILVQSKNGFEIYNTKTHGWEEAKFKYSKSIKKHIRIMNYDLYITDYGVAYFDGKKVYEKHFKGVKDIGGISLNEGYLLTEKGELYKISLAHDIEKTLILKDTSYKGEEIKEVDLIDNFIVIKDSEGSVYIYDIEKREWKKIAESIKKILTSKDNIFLVKDNEAVIYNLKSKNRKEIEKNILEFYPDEDGFLIVVKENGRTALLQINFETERYIVGKGQYKGELNVSDDFYFYNEKIFVLNLQNSLQYYDLKLKEWIDLNIIIDSKVKRVRENDKRLILLTENGTLLEYKDGKIEKESGVRSFELKEDKLYTIDKNGVLRIDKIPNKFKNNSPYPFENILGSIEKDKIYIVFKEGVASYNIEDGDWIKRIDFQQSISEFFVFENNIYGYSGTVLQKLNLEENSLEKIEFNEKILSGKKNWILTSKGNETLLYLNKIVDGKDNYEKYLQNKGVNIKSLSEITSAENYNEKLYVTSGKKVYEYKNGVWKIVKEFPEKVDLIKGGLSNLFLEGDKKLYIFRDNNFELLEKNYKNKAILSKGVFFQFLDKLTYLDFETMSKSDFFQGNIIFQGKINEIYLNEDNLFLTDGEYFYRYDLKKYNWSKLKIGERKNEVFSKDKLYYIKNQEVYSIDLKGKNNLLESHLNIKAEKIWVSSEDKLIYKYGNKLYEDNRLIFEGTKAPFKYEEVKEFISEKNKLYAILQNGYGKYNLTERKWSKKNIPNIKKAKIIEGVIYLLTDIGVYKEDTLLIKEKSIKDFTILKDRLIYVKDNRLVGIKYFSGNGPEAINNLVDYKEYDDNYIFTLDNNIFIYNKSFYQWKSIQNPKKIRSIEVKNNYMYAIGESSIYKYSFEGELLLEKEFDEIVKDYNIGDSTISLLTEEVSSKTLHINRANSWKEYTVKEIPFLYEDIIDVYGDEKKAYFLTKNGVYEKFIGWRKILSESFTGGRFEKYNGELAVIQSEKVTFLKNSRKNKTITNFSYFKNNGLEYLLSEGKLYGSYGKNFIDKEILDNIEASFVHKDKYYYISNFGIGKYDLKTHTWKEKKELFGVLNNYRIIDGTLVLSTKLGSFRIDLDNLEMEKYLVKMDVVDSTLSYAIVKNNDLKLLFEFDGDSFKKVDINKKSIQLGNIEGVDINNGILNIYTKNKIYQYDESDNILLEINENKVGPIIKMGKYKDKTYTMGENKLSISDNFYNIKGYTKGESYFYLINEDGIYDYENRRYIFESLEDIFSKDKNTYFTLHGTYEYNDNFGVYYKVDNENRERWREKEYFILRDKNELIVYKNNVLEERLQIKGGILGFNINGELKTYFEGKELKSFDKQEQIKSLREVKNNKIYFVTTKNKRYSYSIVTKKIESLNKTEEELSLKKEAFKYNGNLKGIFIENGNFLLLNNKGEIISIKMSSLELNKQPKSLINLSGVRYSFQENELIYIKDEKGLLMGSNINSLSYTNTFERIGNKVSLNLNSSNEIEYNLQNNYKGKELLVTEEGINENAFLKGNLKIKIPKNIVLDENLKVKYLYKNMITENKIERKYYYLFNGEMKETKSKDKFRESLSINTFLQDNIISISNNPEDSVYFATSNIVYDKDYKILYSGSGIRRVNSKNGMIYIEKNDGIYTLNKGKLIRAKGSVDKKISLTFNGTDWINETEKNYKIKVLDKFIDKDIFSEKYLVFENFQKVYDYNTGTAKISNGKDIFEYKDYNNVSYLSKDNLSKKISNLNLGNKILLDIINDSKNKILGVDIQEKDIYVLTETNIFRINEEKVSQINFRGKYFKKFNSHLAVFNDKNGYILNSLGEIEQRIEKNSVNKVTIFSNRLESEISEIGEKIQFDRLKNSSTFKNGYFIFDDMSNIDYRNKELYREYDKIAYVEENGNMGKIVNPIKKDRFIKRVTFDFLGSIKIEQEKSKEDKVYFSIEQNKRESLTYNLFENIESDGKYLYLLGAKDSYRVDMQSNLPKFIGKFKAQDLEEKREILGKIINFENREGIVKNSKIPGIKWEYLGVNTENLWEKIGGESYNFIFLNPIDYTGDLTYYTNGEYIFKKEGDIYLKTQMKDIERVEKNNEKIYFLNKGIPYNESLNKVPLSATPFIKKSLDLKDGELKNNDNNKYLVNYDGKNIYGKNGRFTTDITLDLKLNNSNDIYYSSEYGVFKRQSNLLELISSEKNKILERYRNKVLFTEDGARNVTLKKETDVKIESENYKKAIIEDGDFVWNRPRKMMIGDKEHISNIKGEIWNISDSLNIPKYITSKRMINAQEVKYNNEIYLYDNGKIKLNSNLEKNKKVEELNYELIKCLSPNKLGIVFENSKWSIGKNKNKIQLVGVDLKDTFINGKFNFDYIEGIGDKKLIYSNKYLWSIDDRKLNKRMPSEIEDILKFNNKTYFKTGLGWKDSEWNGVKDIIFDSDDKWSWKLDINKKNVTFLNRSNQKLKREFFNGQFKDDVLINIKGTKDNLYISTYDAIISYNFNLDKVTDYLDEYKKQKNFYFDKLNKEISFEPVEVPKEFKNHEYIDYYEKSGIYYLIKRDKIELVNKEKGVENEKNNIF